jgi:4-oxalocrotonate tautomerase
LCPPAAQPPIIQAGPFRAVAPDPPTGYLWCFNAEKTMPLIHVEMFEGRTPEIKREFVEAITRETCRVLKCEPGAVDIIMRDVKKSDWASGGVIWAEKK